MPSITETLLPLRVTDLRQHLYCPRITYYNHVLPVARRETYKMQAARDVHIKLERLEKRRRLKRYRLHEGTRQFRVPLHSERLALSGILDMLITTSSGRYPVEFKLSQRQPGAHQVYQLIAYGLLVEEVFDTTVRVGFIYMEPDERVYEIQMTPSRRHYVKSLLTIIRNQIAAGTFPGATRSKARCRDCEFRLLCGDTDFPTRPMWPAPLS